MKRTALIFLISSLLLILGTATVFAAGQNQTVFKIDSLDPEIPYPGQQVVGIVTYNAADISGLKVDYEVVYELAAEGGVAACPGNECSFTADETGKSTINFYAPDKAGTYSLTINFTVDKQVYSLNPKLKVESALPEGWAQIFAGLGLFAAVMAIMAVGTEVVIESMKMFLGFKSKVTAMEAFDELKSELPGMLAGVGVDANSREKVVKLIEHTEEALNPLENMEDVYNEFKKGNFAETYEALHALQEGDPDNHTEFQNLKNEAKKTVKKGLENLRDQLHMKSEITQKVEEEILRLIDGIDPATLPDILEQVTKKLQLFFRSPNNVKEWLLGQMNLYINEGRAGLNGFLADGKDALKSLGFKPEDIDNWLDPIVDGIEQTARDKSLVYAESVRNLLEQVEERRNEMQSPFRKFWRRLRNNHTPFWIIIIGVVITIISIAIGFPIFKEAHWLIILLTSIGIGLLVTLVLGAIWSWRNPNKKGSPDKGSLGYVLRYRVERFYNFIIGHNASEEAAAHYGEVDPEISKQLQDVSPTSVASTLLALDDLHKDQETTRIRWMRIISIFIGIYLAYHLKVDAATYLAYAVPGVEETINAFDLNQFKIIQYWFPQKLTVGMLLTGFAASAGSKFWRDFLARLQASRGQAEEAAQMVRKVKSTISDLS